MVLHSVLVHDDDIAVAGTAIAAADFYGDDGELDQIDGFPPILRELMLMEYDVLAVDTFHRAYATLQPNNFPNTERITHLWDIAGYEYTGDGGGDKIKYLIGVNGGYKFWAGRYAQAYNPGTSWISDGSKLYSTTANADIALIMNYTYGAPLPFLGNWSNVQIIRKVAGAAMAAADTWDEAFSATMKGVSPGLDPDKEYVIRGAGVEPGATDKINIACRVGVQHQGYKLIAPAAPDMGFFMNVNMFDGIPIMGGDGIIAENVAGVVDTPYVWIMYEEYPGAMSAARGGASPR